MAYNGWTNYETWCVALWIDEVAEMTCPGCRESASFVTDLLGTALDAVDYDEIAQNMHSEITA